MSAGLCLSTVEAFLAKSCAKLDQWPLSLAPASVALPEKSEPARSGGLPTVLLAVFLLGGLPLLTIFGSCSLSLSCLKFSKLFFARSWMVRAYKKSTSAHLNFLKLMHYSGKRLSFSELTKVITRNSNYLPVVNSVRCIVSHSIWAYQENITLHIDHTGIH